MITEKEHEEIRKEAKKLLDNFASALSKVPIKEKRLKTQNKGYREEKGAETPNEEFREIMFNNAPNKDKDCLIAEKKKW